MFSVVQCLVLCTIFDIVLCFTLYCVKGFTVFGIVKCLSLYSIQYCIVFSIIKGLCHVILIVYLYSAQYLHILQDSKRYLTHPTGQVQRKLSSH